MNQPIQRRLLKTKEAAEYLGCSTWQIRELVHEEKLEPVVLTDGGIWRFYEHDLDKFAASCRGNH